jgi:hypothetical protein
MKTKTLLLLICICGLAVMLALRLSQTPLLTSNDGVKRPKAILPKHETSPVPVIGSAQSPSAKGSTTVAVAPPSKPITPEIRAKIEALEYDVLMPVELVLADEALAYRQGAAIRQLAVMQIPEATAALAKILTQPEAKFFASGTTPDGGEWDSHSHQVMVYLYQTIEGVPAPTNGANYTTQDLPAFRQWWNQTNGHITYKRLSVPNVSQK